MTNAMLDAASDIDRAMRSERERTAKAVLRRLDILAAGMTTFDIPGNCPDFIAGMNAQRERDKASVEWCKLDVEQLFEINRMT